MHIAGREFSGAMRTEPRPNSKEVSAPHPAMRKQRSSATEVGGIFLGEVSPLLRQIVLRKDGRHGAGRDASAAVDALDRVNKKLIGLAVTVFVLFGVDAIDGTGVHTGGVLGADTGFCNTYAIWRFLRGD